VPQVRLIDEQGEQVGILPTSQALQMAEERGLDLVEVAPNADPPVCRLMDYGKFLYDQAKKEREARKNQKIVDVKGIRLEPNTSDFHLEVKSNQARRFLDKGDKVKFTVRFRGRQLAHLDIGTRILENLAEALRDVAVVEQRPIQEGRSQSMLLAPAPKASKRSERVSQSTASQPAPEPAEAVEG
jgi:translation initiation factor IF-3